MARTLSLRASAQSDLEDIWLYSDEQWGMEQADAYLYDLLERVHWLTEHPLTGKKRDDIKKGYYSFPAGMHLIFYTLTQGGIEVIGIPHQSMDVMNHVPGFNE